MKIFYNHSMLTFKINFSAITLIEWRDIQKLNSISKVLKTVNKCRAWIEIY